MRKITKHYPLIYARYVFPLLANLLMLVTAFIPFIQFSLDSDKRTSMSLAELLKNCWDNSRIYLFSANTKQTNDGLLFYRSVFAILIICLLLFVVATAMNVFAAIASGSYFFGRQSKLKNVYTSIVPNRIVMLVFELPLLPMMFFPAILVYLYRNILLYNVSVEYRLISPAAISVILLSLSFIIIIVSRKKEILLGKNIFSYDKNQSTQNLSDDKKEDASDIQAEKHYRMNGSGSDETESLRRLLGFSGESEDDQEQE